MPAAISSGVSVSKCGFFEDEPVGNLDDVPHNWDFESPDYSQEPNFFYFYPEHFALFASFAVNDFFTAKSAKDAKIV